MREGEPHIEEEKSPEQVVESAISAIENEDAADSVISSEWATKAKEFAKTSGKIVGVSHLVSLMLTGRIIKAAYKSAKTVIEKRGKFAFREGYEIGKEIFSFENKKEKK